MRNLYAVMLLLLTALLTRQVDAATARLRVQDLAAIRAAAEAHVTDTRSGGSTDLQVTVGRLDARLRLPACELPLSATQPPGAPGLGPTSVNVRCDGAAPWSIFVPVMVREKRRIVVATRALPAGHTVAATDVTVQEKWIGERTAQYFEDAAAVVGKQVQRPLPAGAVLPVNGIRSPRAIRRGANITLALERGPIAVRMAGVALQDGAVGDRIQARNTNSRRVVEGIVGVDGVLRVR
ncbi:MAG: flagellar basal body P-ring formation chaperone FlgA [Gammaproteobacteria bacterium]